MTDMTFTFQKHKTGQFPDFYVPAYGPRKLDCKLLKDIKQGFTSRHKWSEDPIVA